MPRGASMVVVVKVEEVGHALEGRARLGRSSSRWRSLRLELKNKLLQRPC